MYHDLTGWEFAYMYAVGWTQCGRSVSVVDRFQC